MGIKAIETAYKGYRFRSRTEARWAIFFDVLGVKWEYEKEGFDMNGTLYLPDFWLPQQQAWIEIKGDVPTEAEKMKCETLFKLRDESVFLFPGTPDCCNVGDGGFGWFQELVNCGGGWSFTDGCYISRCSRCGDVTIDHRDTPGCNAADPNEYVGRVNNDWEPMSVCCKRGSWFHGPGELATIYDAIKTARSARFEHGETPQ